MRENQVIVPHMRRPHLKINVLLYIQYQKQMHNTNGGKKSHFLISTFCCVQKEDRFFRCCPSQPRPLLLPQTRLPRGLPGQHHGRPHCPRQPQHPPPHSGHQHAAKPRPPETPGPSQPLTGQTPASSRWQQRRHPLQPSDWPKP